MLLVVLALAQVQGTWQQDVRYRISAALDERAGVLSGLQVLHYRNQSPDTLTTVSFHLYLNAFRAGSRWVAADSAEGLDRYASLPDPLYGFNHMARVEVGGVPVEPHWPFAPDSTIARLALPRPLAPGDSIEITMSWDARPPFPPRRSGRRGRHFDFGQWYPRIVVYDRHGWNEQPLLPSGEFYGEFGTYLVQLDVAADQVVGATGVPLCGDPGWERASSPTNRRLSYQRDWYESPRDPLARRVLADSTACSSRMPGRKTIVWYAENVHHFAMSLSPEYRYEEGDFLEIPVRVLYQRGDERSWGAGVATGRTETALAWLHDLLGPYPWPQITTVHRIEGGGTEYPMMVHNGSAGQGLIMHEVGHNYLMGILANNEWREGWLDEGFSSFLTSWFFETQGMRGAYQRVERRVLEWDLDELSEPVSQPADSFRDAATYRAMTYDRGELFFHQLRAAVGDEALRRILRTYYERYRFRHVDEQALRSVAEEVSRRDLRVFFAQWLHDVVLYDYAVGDVRREELPQGGWRTSVEVVRKAPGQFPVAVWVFATGDTAWVRAVGAAEREWVEVRTRTRPNKVILDARLTSHDWNVLNNQKTLSFRPWVIVARGDRPTEQYIDFHVSRRSLRDRLSVGWGPLAWYNDAGGWTFGLRTRSDYIGRYELSSVALTQSTGWGVDAGRTDLDAHLVFRNPIGLRAPGVTQRLELASLEGRLLAAAGIEKTWRRSLAASGSRTLGLSLAWLRTSTQAYLDPGFYDGAGTIELTGTGRLAGRGAAARASLDIALAAGFVYRDAEQTPATIRRDQPYGRITVAAAARRSVLGPLSVAGRAFVGLTLAPDALVRQRLVYVAGADPYERFDNPFLRSRGAIFVREGVFYHEPGGAGVRGLVPTIAARHAYGLSLEAEAELYGGGRGVVRRAAFAAFADGALADGDLDQSGGNALHGVADAGFGFRTDHRIGDTDFQLRLDFPLWVSQPALAHDDRPGDQPFGFRWTVSLVPAF